MNFNEKFDELSNQLKTRDWFYDISRDKYGRVVVYALWMSGDILSEVPHTLCGKQVLLHFANIRKEEDHKMVSLSDLHINDYEEDREAKEAVVETTDEITSLSELTNKLDKLEKICGTNTLGDIFFESHDGKNAVTNWSAKFPDIRKDMDKLLNKFGFDVLYEELEL